MPDHSNIFKNLENHLKSKGNFTVILDPRKCHNFSSVTHFIDNEIQNQFNEVRKILLFEKHLFPLLFKKKKIDRYVL